MIAWAYLLCRAARRHLARRKNHHCIRRCNELYQQRGALDHELLSALKAQHAAEQRLHRLVHENK